MTVEAAEVVAARAAATTYDDLPAAVVARTKQCILDTLACMIAGSGTGDVAALRRIALRWGGAGESTIVSSGEKVPAYAAVLLNAAMAHQYDFDDTHDVAVCHPTSATLSAALATAESVGGVSGRELIAAVALGNDLIPRLGLAIRGTLWDFPWVRAPVIGIFGAALAAGKILGLDAAQLRNALGFALPQAAGTLECLRGEESAVRGMRDGLIYKDAILATLLAAEGLRGDQGVFDGEYGLFRSYFRGEYDRGQIVDGLGERYEGMNVSLKPWPSCRHTHATLTALTELVERPGFDPDAVVEIVVHVGDGNRRIAVPPGEAYVGRMALLCNIPYAVAVVFSQRSFPLWTVSERGASDGSIRAALDRVRCEHDPRQNRHGTIEPGHVLLRFRDGGEWEAEADRALGHPSLPLSDAQLDDKVRSVAAAAARPLSAPETERLIEQTHRLEELPDAGELAALTAPRSAG